MRAQSFQESFIPDVAFCFFPHNCEDIRSVYRAALYTELKFASFATTHSRTGALDKHHERVAPTQRIEIGH